MKYVLKEQYQDFEGSQNVQKQKFMKKYIWFTLPSKKKEIEAEAPVIIKPEAAKVESPPPTPPPKKKIEKPKPKSVKKKSKFSEFMNNHVKKQEEKIKSQIG